MMKRLHLRIHEASRGPVIQAKGTKNIFKEIIAEKFTNLGNAMDSQV
jgi:hypothetical protein